MGKPQKGGEGKKGAHGLHPDFGPVESGWNLAACHGAGADVSVQARLTTPSGWPRTG